MPDLKKILEHLLEREVEFVLIGGFAAVLHGSASVTQDIDVSIPFTEENMGKLAQALRPLHPQLRAGSGWIPLEELKNPSAHRNLYLHTDAGALDLLGSVMAMGGYEKLSGHTVTMELFGKSCRVLDLPSLIASKKAMNRPKDRMVVLELKAIQEKLEKIPK